MGDKITAPVSPVAISSVEVKDYPESEELPPKLNLPVPKVCKTHDCHYPDIHIVGWSESGKVAYLETTAHFPGYSFEYRFVILDLPQADTLFLSKWTDEPAMPDRERTYFDLEEFWKAREKTFLEAMNNHGIARSLLEVTPKINSTDKYQVIQKTETFQDRPWMTEVRLFSRAENRELLRENTAYPWYIDAELMGVMDLSLVSPLVFAKIEQGMEVEDPYKVEWSLVDPSWRYQSPPRIEKPKELVLPQYLDYLEANSHLIPARIYPVGFSWKGHFAYIYFVPVEAEAAVDFRFVILDGKTGKNVFENQYRSMEATYPQPITYDEVWDLKKGLWGQKIAEYEINTEKCRGFKFDMYYNWGDDFELELEWASEAEMEKAFIPGGKRVKLARLMDKGPDGKRRILAERKWFQEEYDWGPIGCEVNYYFVNSAEEGTQIVFLLEETQRGWEGAPHPVYFDLVNVNLPEE